MNRNLKSSIERRLERKDRRLANGWFITPFMVLLIPIFLGILILHFSINAESALAAIPSYLLIMVTLLYVQLTRRLVEVQNEPKISVYVRPDGDAFNLANIIIANLGQGPAYDITFKVNPDFEYIQNARFSDINLVKNGIAYLAPKQQVEFFLASYLNYKNKVPCPFSIFVIYYDSSNKRYQERFLVDISEHSGILVSDTKPLAQIAKLLGEIKTELYSLRMQLKDKKEMKPAAMHQ